MSSEVSKNKKLSGKALVVIVIIITLGGACGFMLLQYRKASAALPADDAGRIAAITRQLRKTVALPTGDAAIAHVVDASKLTDPQLAAQAKNGDDLLVYAKAKRVILYRPSTHQVIDMFRITQGVGQTNGTTTQPSQGAQSGQ